MANFIADVYVPNGVGATVVASSTPNDGIFNNLVIGSRGGDFLYGEATAGVYNEFHALRGNDFMYGGGGTGSINTYIGDSGVDTAMMPIPSNGAFLQIDYQGGLQINRPDGGVEYVSSDTEIAQFTGGNRIIVISGGADDSTSESSMIAYQFGDALALSQDWLAALNSGNVGISVYDVNGDGILDTSLTGYNGVNSYALLGYNMNFHAAQIVGVFGEGILFDLA